MQDAQEMVELLTSELEAGIPSKELVDQRMNETHVLVDRSSGHELCTWTGAPVLNSSVTSPLKNA